MNEKKHTHIICMKFIFAALYLTISQNSNAQYFLNTVKGNSGIITKASNENNTSGLNYNTTDSRFGITTARFILDKWNGRDSVNVVGTDSFPRIPNATQISLNGGVSVTDGEGSLFSKGSFSPSIDGSVDFIRYHERHKKNGNDDGGYKAIFGRVKLSVADNKYAVINEKIIDQDDLGKPILSNLAIVNSKTGTVLGIGGGYNAISRDEETRIGSISAAYTSNWNSTDDLEKKQVSVQQIQGIDDKGNAVIVNDTEDRYYGNLTNHFNKLQIRLDGIVKLGNFKKDIDNVIIALTGAISSDIRASKNNSFNIAVGPSIHTPHSITQVIGALLFELNDATNALENSPSFKDRFSVKAYVSIPFSFLK